jgi:hypothetical protein
MSNGKTLQNADESFKNLNVSNKIISPSIVSSKLNTKIVYTDELVLNGVPFVPTVPSVGNSIVLAQNFGNVSFNVFGGSTLLYTPEGVYNSGPNPQTPITAIGDFINSEFIDNSNPSNWIILKSGIYLFELNASVVLTAGPLTQQLISIIRINSTDNIISTTGQLNTTTGSFPL